MKINFRKVKKSDQPTILNWFKEKHVQEFYYGEGLQSTLRNLELYCNGIHHNERYSFEHWIGLHDGTPFAFLMTTPIVGPYDPKDAYNQWHIANKKTFTLDILIGAKEFLGKGLAADMIRKFILAEYASADFFLIDPEASNHKAIHVYEKVGFKKVGEFYPTNNTALHCMMRLGVRDARMRKQSDD